MSRSLLLLFVTSLFLFASCKPDPTSTNNGGNNTGGNDNGGNGTGGPPAFGYTVNGNAFNRNDYPSLTTAEATAEHVSGQNWLTIYLNFTPGSTGPLKTQELMLRVTYSTPVPATFVLNGYDKTASLVVDTLSYGALPGGVLTITKFDTINNLVSGTFHFIAFLGYPVVDSSVHDSIAGGSFTDVPIYEGSYNQGTISAEVDGFHMSSKGGSNGGSGANNAAAYTAKEYATFTIHGVSNDGTFGNREVVITLASIGTGTFPLTGTVGPYQTHAATYQWHNEYTGADTSMSATSGTLKITTFDTLTRRMSGTFSFSGIGYPGGDSIRVTNGVIDNVQWSVF